MRKEEFIQAAKRYNRRALVVFSIPSLVAILLAIFYKPFENWFGNFLGRRISGPVPEILKLLPIVAVIAAAIGAIIPLTRRNDREMGVACPRCGKPLATFKAIVVASKNCPFCGAKVLDDTP